MGSRANALANRDWLASIQKWLSDFCLKKNRVAVIWNEEDQEHQAGNEDQELSFEHGKCLVPIKHPRGDAELC